jgi:hypothetical protein
MLFVGLMPHTEAAMNNSLCTLGFLKATWVQLLETHKENIIKPIFPS